MLDGRGLCSKEPKSRSRPEIRKEYTLDKLAVVAAAVGRSRHPDRGHGKNGKVYIVNRQKGVQRGLEPWRLWFE